MTQTALDLLGKKFCDFWDCYNQKYQDFPTKNIYYEVLIDFCDFVYDNTLPLEANLQKAYDYLTEHSDDY